MPAVAQTVDQVRRIDVDQYKYGFVTDIESDKAPKGLSEDIVRFISAKKNEPEWMLAWRLDAYRRWLTMREPSWARVTHPPIDYQSLYYYAAPKKKKDGRSRSTRSIPRSSRLTRSSASRRARWRYWSASSSPRAKKVETATAVWRSMPCSTRSRWRRPSSRSSRRPASCSCRSPRRCRSTPIW